MQNQDGFVIREGYKPYSLRANLEVNASKRLKFGLNVAPTYSVTQDPGVEGKDQIFHQALSLALYRKIQWDYMLCYKSSTGQNRDNITGAVAPIHHMVN